MYLQTLLNGIQNSRDQKERNTLTVQLAFVANAHPDILAQIEALITSSNDPTDTLILSYGALASSLSPDLQHRIVIFLVNRINQTTDPSILVHYTHALGNTQSPMANSVCISLLSHGNSNVKLAAVYALRYSTGYEEVQSALLHALQSDPSEELTEMALRSLIAGSESKIEPINGQLLHTIVDTAVRQNSTELRALLGYYAHLVGTNSWSVSHLNKRGTVWNERNGVYDLVQDAATRDTDLRSYPLNRAYIWGRSLGVPQLGMRAAFGSFAGFGGDENPSSFKLFAKGIARAHAFGKSKTIFEALLTSEHRPESKLIKSVMYVSGY